MTSPLPTDEDARDEIGDVLSQVAMIHGDETGTMIPIDHARDALFSAGFRRSVVSTPSDDVRDLMAAGEAQAKDLLRAGVGRHSREVNAGRIIRRLIAALNASAVSAPPTITDEMRHALTSAAWEALEPRLEDHIHLDLNDVEESAQFRSLIDAVVESVVAALGGEEKNDG